MTAEEMMLRRLYGQHLLEKTDALTVVRDLCGVQAQFLSHAMHAMRIRSHRADVSGMVKGWTNRGTMHLFAENDLPMFLHRDRRHFLRPVDRLDGDGVMTAQRKAYFAEMIVDAVGQGIDGREALKSVCASGGMTEMELRHAFDPWGGLIRALCEAGRICQKPQEQKAYRLCPPFEPMEAEAARMAMCRRYFTHFGPATVKDAAYFFGFTQAEVKRCIAQLPVHETLLDGRTYFFINHGEAAGDCPECLFLAGFDQMILGYDKKESLFLPEENVRDVFSRAGMVHPTVLVRGRVAGVWKMKNNHLQVRLFAPGERSGIVEAAGETWAQLSGVEFCG